MCTYVYNVCACMHACSVHVHGVCVSGMNKTDVHVCNMMLLLLLQPRVLNWPQVFAI